MNAQISANENSASASESVSVESANSGHVTIGLEDDLENPAVDTGVKRKQVSIDVLTAVGFAREVVVRLEPYREQLERLEDFDMKSLDGLEPSAAAAMDADVAFNRPTPVSEVTEGRVLREELLRSAELMVFVGVADAARVAAIRAGKGRRSIPGGLLGLAELFREIWDRVDGKVPVTPEQLERARVLSVELSRGVRKFGHAHRAKGAARRMRQQALALLVYRYEECRAAMTYLRRREGDVDSIIPSLYSARRRARKVAAQAAVEPGSAG